ncbi:hypothetical protein Tsubulata_012125 [Turnera subulata]|uniref:CCHC-type domain-containing protein n=1 Tax=Turnera subulata TaxID=218843 RepID=A0A9Q0FED4_9ROSI|nr:hypothetical protein Tsubulata_012125 [Turnera subulata]
MVTDESFPAHDDYAGVYDEPTINFESEGESEPSEVGSVLVGKVISEVRRFSTKVVADSMTRAWNLSKPLLVNEVKENTFLFNIESESDLFRILASAPWSITGNHLCLKEWPANRVLNEVKFESLDFWVQVYGLPPHWMKRSKAVRMAGLFPEVLEYELPPDDSCLWGEFFRLRARIKIDEPLPTGFITKGVEDMAIHIDFKFEELADFCYYCGRIGHVEKDCASGNADKRVGRRGRHPAGYGPYLHATKSYGRWGIGRFLGRTDAKVKLDVPPQGARVLTVQGEVRLGNESGQVPTEFLNSEPLASKNATHVCPTDPSSDTPS